MVVVVDGNEQVGLPSPVEEAIFRAGSRGTHPGSPRLSLMAEGSTIPVVLLHTYSWTRK